MDENTFWISIWRAVAAAICVLVVSIGGCVAHGQHLVSMAINNGADPIKAGCAINGINGSTSAAICAAAAVK